MNMEVSRLRSTLLLIMLIGAWAPSLRAQTAGITVTITSPSAGAVIGGTVTVRAEVTVTGTSAVKNVQFKLDGANLGAADSTAPYAISWDTLSVSNGSHRLTAAVRHTEGPSFASEPVRVTVNNDATPPGFVRVEQTNAALDFSGSWVHGDTTFNWSGATASYTRLPEARVNFTFQGTRVRWIGMRSPRAGIARVYLDGVALGEVDLYSNKLAVPTAVFTSEVLPEGIHTLIIESTGTANPLATNRLVAVDAFDVDATVYSLTDLGTLGGAASVARDINNLGEVVGWTNIGNGQRRAFLYRDGTMTDLGTLVGGSYSEAMAINDNSQVVGFSGINAYGPQFREFMNGFVWQEGTMKALSAAYCPCSFNRRYGTSTAYGINDSGQAVGGTGTVRGESVIHAARWQSPYNSTAQDIGAGAGDWEISRAFGINDAGQVVGDFAPEAGNMGIAERNAFLWENGIRQNLRRLTGHDAGTALEINEAGMIVGWSGSPDATVSRPVLWYDGGRQDLGALRGATNGQAFDINASAQVVGWSGSPIPINAAVTAGPGWSETSDPSAARAFLWQNNRMFDLNLVPALNANGVPGAISGWVLTQAAAINDAGEIVGIGFHNGEMRGFLLSPVAD